MCILGGSDGGDTSAADTSGVVTAGVISIAAEEEEVEESVPAEAVIGFSTWSVEAAVDDVDDNSSALTIRIAPVDVVSAADVVVTVCVTV